MSSKNKEESIFVIDRLLRFLYKLSKKYVGTDQNHDHDKKGRCERKRCRMNRKHLRLDDEKPDILWQSSFA